MSRLKLHRVESENRHYVRGLADGVVGCSLSLIFHTAEVIVG